MLEFQTMKKVLAVMARFCTVSLAFELVHVFSLIMAASMRNDASMLDIITAGALTRYFRQLQQALSRLFLLLTACTHHALPAI
jgi:hypothetical protein